MDIWDENWTSNLRSHTEDGGGRTTRFSHSVTSPGCIYLRLSGWSHAGVTQACLTNHCISYIWIVSRVTRARLRQTSHSLAFVRSCARGRPGGDVPGRFIARGFSPDAAGGRWPAEAPSPPGRPFRSRGERPAARAIRWARQRPSTGAQNRCSHPEDVEISDVDVGVGQAGQIGGARWRGRRRHVVAG